MSVCYITNWTGIYHVFTLWYWLLRYMGIWVEVICDLTPCIKQHECVLLINDTHTRLYWWVCSEVGDTFNSLLWFKHVVSVAVLPAVSVYMLHKDWFVSSCCVTSVNSWQSKLEICTIFVYNFYNVYVFMSGCSYFMTTLHTHDVFKLCPHMMGNVLSIKEDTIISSYHICKFS